MKKTKIVCSIGPSSSEIDVLRKMIQGGMDVARFDLGKLSYSFCTETVDKIHKLEKELGKTIGIFFENRGPEMRVGTISNGKVYLKAGNELLITTESIIGNEEKIYLNYPNLLNDAQLGMELLFNSGRVKVKMLGKKDDMLLCEVLEEGYIFSHETVHIPKLDYSLSYLNEKNKEDILFAIGQDVDFLGLSFIRNSNDVLDVTDLLIEEENDHIQLITKIENEACLEDLDRIIELSDGLMIARGDLGIELPIEQLPGIQKSVIMKVHQENKLGIVSTEMLASMEHDKRPTRAEVSDVYNAVMDLADAVSLGNETSSGLYPVESVETMVNIVNQAEQETDYEQVLQEIRRNEKQDVTSLIAHAVVDIANHLNANAIVTPTNSGYTAKKISRFRPKCMIIATSPIEDTVRSLTLHYGVYPTLAKEYATTDEIVDHCGTKAKEILNLKKGNHYVITGGFPASLQNTNFIRVEEVSE